MKFPKLICFNTHGYTGVEQVTSLCKKLTYLKILPGQNFVKFNNLMYSIQFSKFRNRLFTQFEPFR